MVSARTGGTGMPQPTRATGVVLAARVASMRELRCSVRRASILACAVFVWSLCLLMRRVATALRRSDARYFGELRAASKRPPRSDAPLNLSESRSSLKSWASARGQQAFFDTGPLGSEMHSSSATARNPVPSRWLRSRLEAPAPTRRLVCPHFPSLSHPHASAARRSSTPRGAARPRASIATVGPWSSCTDAGTSTPRTRLRTQEATAAGASWWTQ